MYYKREELLRFIRHYIREHGYPPNLREMAEGCGMSSTSVVTHHLKMLEREGYIERDSNLARAIKLKDT